MSGILSFCDISFSLTKKMVQIVATLWAKAQINDISEILQIGRFQGRKLFQLLSVGKRKYKVSKREVEPLTNSIKPHVDCC